jgi:maltose/maltodextrin transport system permease protein
MRIMTDPGIQSPFMQIFVWTVIFSACSVAFTLAIGMVLACLVQWEQLRGVVSTGSC